MIAAMKKGTGGKRKKETDTQSQPQLEFGASEQSDKSDLISFDHTLLALSSIKGLGRSGASSIFDAFNGKLSGVWFASQSELFNILSKAKIPAAERTAATLIDKSKALLDQAIALREKLASQRISVLSRSELPRQLQEIPDGPRWLFVQGNANALFERPTIAVVGTRNPTAHGLRAAEVVAKVLAAYPITLVSGLAEGIDEKAHSTSLQEGVCNIAFLGHGINLVFPAATRPIREEIIEKGGAIATEYFPDEHYRKPYFVQRNRLQAALADVVIPVEANPKGGTAHTVRFARKYQRPIIGIKWNNANGILDDLIKDGEQIIEIFTAEGCRKLDGVIRDLAEKAGHETFALKTIEKRLMAEARWRQVQQSDIDKLKQVLDDLAARTTL